MKTFRHVADMGYLDGPTQTGTLFGTTTALGIPNINGHATNVMGFPKLNDEFGGYNAPHGAAGNGGGFAVNQYSVIMDVLFPASASGKTRTLFVTDAGGEFQINAADPCNSCRGLLPPAPRFKNQISFRVFRIFRG